MAKSVLESFRDARSFTSSAGDVGFEVSAGSFDLRGRSMMKTDNGWPELNAEALNMHAGRVATAPGVGLDVAEVSELEKPFVVPASG